jgi:hypothetical protein
MGNQLQGLAGALVVAACTGRRIAVTSRSTSSVVRPRWCARLSYTAMTGSNKACTLHHLLFFSFQRPVVPQAGWLWNPQVGFFEEPFEHFSSNRRRLRRRRRLTAAGAEAGGGEEAVGDVVDAAFVRGSNGTNAVSKFRPNYGRRLDADRLAGGQRGLRGGSSGPPSVPMPSFLNDFLKAQRGGKVN